MMAAGSAQAHSLHGSVRPTSCLRDEVAQAFSSIGTLSQADPQYRQRDQQADLADAVAEALDHRSVLVAEAGTGVGKTYAYLVPLLLSGLRAMVSTATKGLQDQLYLRDLPRLVAAFGLPLRTALLKGRSSYLCTHRLNLARQSAMLPDRHSVRQLARVEEWATTTVRGDLAELPSLDEHSPVIPLVTSTRENCLGSDCTSLRDCHLMTARREALQADVVVVNHHLFFADLMVRDTGMAELLPTVDAVVFDEAHQLNEAGVQFLGRQLGSGQLMDLSRDVLATGLAQARGLQDWQELAGKLEHSARTLRLASVPSQRAAAGGGIGGRLRWETLASDPQFLSALNSVLDACGAVSAGLKAVAGASADLDKLDERCMQLQDLARGFSRPTPPGEVRWVDIGLNQARLAQAPLDIRDAMREQVEQVRRAWIFTSATLGDDDALTWFTRGIGVEDARTLRVGSPFNYPDHARLLVPSHFPRPSEPGHGEAVARLAADCAEALGGRTFVLTTTLRALQTIGARLRDRLGNLTPPIEVLVQGEASKRALLAQFMSRPRAVLVGSHSFWEGIDVPGTALQCVLIDKLPFPPPNDPLAEARARVIESEGGSAFDDYFVPEAAIALKQGAGRLIRSETDQGLLVICDPRLLVMPYGQRLLGALPPMGLLDRPEAAMAWLRRLNDGSSGTAHSNRTEATDGDGR